MIEPIGKTQEFIGNNGICLPAVGGCVGGIGGLGGNGGNGGISGISGIGGLKPTLHHTLHHTIYPPYRHSTHPPYGCPTPQSAVRLYNTAERKQY